MRPTAQLVKDALFNMLQAKIYQAEVLDLFSGTGQIGLEALSRGAAGAVFVDKDISLSLRNAALLDVSPLMLRGDFRNIMRSLANQGKQFDIIFADPPYEAGYYNDIITLAGALLSQDGVLALEHDRREQIEPQGSMRVIKRREYGRRGITLMERGEE